MPRENLSPTLDADSPVMPCEIEARALYPVRYAFSPSSLRNFVNNTESYQGRTRKIVTADFELRRLRQGYIYILVQGGILPIDETSDNDARWLVYRYETALDDENSGFTEFDFDLAGRGHPYSFIPIKWKDGDPKNPWTFDTNSAKSCISLLDTITKIEIAYSEEPWPASLFEKVASDPAVRQKLMIAVDLVPRSTDESYSLEAIDKAVEEFKPDAINRQQDYAICHTGFKPDSPQILGLTPKQRKEGRFIALPDSVGELMDVNRLMFDNSATRNQHGSEHIYPLTIGHCIEQVQSHLKSELQHLKAKLGADWAVQHDSLRKDILNTQDTLSKRIENLRICHQALCESAEPYGIRELFHPLLHELSASSITTPSQLELLAHTSKLWVRCFQTISSSFEGSNYLSETLDPDNNSAMGLVFRTLMSTWSTVNEALLNRDLKKLITFDLLLEVTHTELGKLGTAKIKQLGIPQAIRKLHDIEVIGRRPMSANQLNELLKTGKVPNEISEGQPIKNSGNLQQPDIRAGKTKLNSTAPKTDSVDTLFIVEHGRMRPAAHFNRIIENQRIQRGVGTGLSAFLNMWACFDLLTQANNDTRHKTWMGAVGNNRAMNLGLSFVVLVDEMVKLGSQFRNAYVDDLSSKITEETLEKHFPELKKAKHFSVESIKGTSANKYGKANLLSKSLRLAGAGASAILAVFTVFQAFEAKANQQDTKFVYLLAQFFASFAMLALTGIPAVVAGVVLFLAVIGELVFSKNKLQAWAKHSFWGSSDKYWEVARVETSKLIEKSKQQLQDDKQLQQYLEQELSDFKDLVLRPQVISISPKKGVLELYLPRIEDKNYALAVDIWITYKVLDPTTGNYSTPDAELDSFNIEVNELDGTAIVNFAQQLAKSQPELPGYVYSVHAECHYKDSTGHEYDSFPVLPIYIESPKAQRWWYRIPNKTLIGN